jgi:REP element-mobilizing transposase RayT
MSQGDQQKPIFRDDQDRECFLETLGETCAKTGWHVHAYCLMKNHFHLVLETPQPNLVVGMKWWLGTYTGWFNRRHKLLGRVFSGRYKSLIVDGRSTGYLRRVCDYVHLNPVRARLLAPRQRLRTFRWSSMGHYLHNPSQRPPWLRVDRMLRELRIPKDSPAGRRQFERYLETRRQAGDNPADWKRIRRGWCLGGQAFRQELLKRMPGRWREYHYGEERRQSAQQQQAEQLIRKGLRQARWTEKDLVRRAKGDPLKLRLAARLREETTMTLKWIAERLQMGSWKHLNRQLYEKRKDRR